MFNKKRYNALAHRLVYHHFYGEIPDGMTINHINGNKKDNRPINLELATHSEQLIHATHTLKKGRAANQWGTKNHAAKLTQLDVLNIRKRRAAGESLKSIAQDFPVSYQTISKIALGQRRQRE